MLPFFPAPLPDELLYSLIARHHRLSCCTSPKATLEQLFGHQNVRASMDLPGHLGSLADRLPASLGPTANDLAQRYTLLPYHVALQPRDTAAAALRAMVNGTTSGLHLRLGLGVTAHRKIGLRYCPACWEEETGRGERCWQRSHQLPGVLVCPVHAQALHIVNLDRLRIGQHEFFAAEDVRNEQPPCPALPQEATRVALLKGIAQESLTYLAYPLTADAPIHSGTARDLCAEHGLMRSPRQADLARLAELHQRALAPLKGLLPEADDMRWLFALVRHHRAAVRPLQAILFRLILAAGDGIRPRRPKPAPRHFLMGDSSFEDRLRLVMSQSLGLPATARAVGVDTRTVRRHAARLGLPSPWTAATEQPSVTSSEPPVAYGQWLAAIDAHPSEGTAALRRRAPAAFAWLYRHDRDWLRNHSPDRQVRTPRPRIDWSALDQEICARVEDAALVVRARIPPERITFVALERVLARSRWIADRKSKLPLTAARMGQTAETTADFQLRRLAWVRAELSREGGPVLEWQARRRAGLPGSASASPGMGQPHG